jgi:hypothetical protein
MDKPNGIFVKVDGMEFELTWMDYGTFRRLTVFQNGKSMGRKDFPIATDTGRGVVEYTVRSILKGAQNVSASK